MSALNEAFIRRNTYKAIILRLAIAILLFRTLAPDAVTAFLLLQRNCPNCKFVPSFLIMDAWILSWLDITVLLNTGDASGLAFWERPVSGIVRPSRRNGSFRLRLNPNLQVETDDPPVVNYPSM